MRKSTINIITIAVAEATTISLAQQETICCATICATISTVIIAIGVIAIGVTIGISIDAILTQGSTAATTTG